MKHSYFCGMGFTSNTLDLQHCQWKKATCTVKECFNQQIADLDGTLLLNVTTTLMTNAAPELLRATQIYNFLVKL